MPCLQKSDWLIDVRNPDGDDKLSMDLSRHLPQRLTVGLVVVLADNPRVFLSVVRKRLARLSAMLENRRCQTMNKRKRAGLARELMLLRAHRFTAKLIPRALPADVTFVSPENISIGLPYAQTVYITTPLLEHQLITVLDSLRPGGLLVTYGPWPPHYESIIDQF